MHTHGFGVYTHSILCSNSSPIRLVPGACPCCDSGARGWQSWHFRCDEVGSCPGHTDSLSAVSPRKCCVLMRCDRGAEVFKDPGVSLSCC